MSDRGILFLFSVCMIAAGLGAAAWLIATGQAGTVDGLFLVLTALVAAAAFALYPSGPAAPPKPRWVGQALPPANLVERAVGRRKRLPHPPAIASAARPSWPAPRRPAPVPRARFSR